MTFRFFLGTHMPHWLSTMDFPLFVSRVRLEHRKTLPRARGPWALDSGGFTELQRYGRWTISAREYSEGSVEITNPTNRTGANT